MSRTAQAVVGEAGLGDLLLEFVGWFNSKGMAADIGAAFDRASGMARSVGCTLEGMLDLIAHPPLSSLETEDAACGGLFISACIEASRVRYTRIVLDTSKLKVRLDWVGYRNRTNEIAVRGDVGDHAGAMMSGGALEVAGNAGSFVGYRMGAGSICVSGGCGDYAGCLAGGGALLVRGVAGDRAGCLLCGGQLRVLGGAGHEVGLLMHAGLILLGHPEGSSATEEEGVEREASMIAGERLGAHMCGGRVVATGNVGHKTGEGMAGGEIAIRGDVGDLAGRKMTAGSIVLDGWRHSPRRYLALRVVAALLCYALGVVLPLALIAQTISTGMSTDIMPSQPGAARTAAACILAAVSVVCVLLGKVLMHSERCARARGRAGEKCGEGMVGGRICLASAATEGPRQGGVLAYSSHRKQGAGD